MFPSAGRRLRLVRAAAPRRALLLHGARGHGLVRGPRPGPRVNPRTGDQEQSRACPRAWTRVGPHDDGAAANPFPALGLLGNARPGWPTAESSKGKKVNRRDAGWRRIFAEGAGRSLHECGACFGVLQCVDFFSCSSRVHFRICPQEVTSGSNCVTADSKSTPPRVEWLGPIGTQGVMTPRVAGWVSCLNSLSLCPARGHF